MDGTPLPCEWQKKYQAKSDQSWRVKISLNLLLQLFLWAHALSTICLRCSCSSFQASNLTSDPTLNLVIDTHNGPSGQIHIQVQIHIRIKVHLSNLTSVSFSRFTITLLICSLSRCGKIRLTSKLKMRRRRWLKKRIDVTRANFLARSHFWTIFSFRFLKGYALTLIRDLFSILGSWKILEIMIGKVIPNPVSLFPNFLPLINLWWQLTISHPSLGLAPAICAK